MAHQQLWFLRHGEAEPHGTRADFDRRLSERGERQSRLAGEALAALGCRFAHVFTSPRVRALDTARLACRALALEPIVHEPLSNGFDRDEALALLAGMGDGAHLLLVGHEPDFSQAIHDLGGGRIAMKKGGVAGLRVERGAGELLVLLRPRELEAIAA